MKKENKIFFNTFFIFSITFTIVSASFDYIEGIDYQYSNILIAIIVGFVISILNRRGYRKL
jgi:hypothetical protein